MDKKIIKHLQKLKIKKYRQEFKEFVIEGKKIVLEALNSNYFINLILIQASLQDEKDIQKIIHLAKIKHIPLIFIKQTEIKKIKTTVNFPGILAVLDQQDFKLEDLINKKQPIFAYYEINDPGNLGTILRTGDWFRFNNFLFSENSVEIYNPKTIRSTMGSIFRSKFFKTQNLIKTLQKLKKEYNYTIIGLDINRQAKPIQKIKKPNKKIFLFGNEARGLSSDLKKIIDDYYYIPGQGQAESLNLAVSSSILMFKIFENYDG